jgi:polysaccharide export outer membrane protein
MITFLPRGAWRVGLVGLVALVLCGCATDASTVSSDECPVPPFSNSEYVIGPGDNLKVVVWRADELSANVPVRPDGRISTPLVDDIEASGKTPSELAGDMEEVLSEFIRTPDVSVIVESQGTSNQIQVVGEVADPQSISYREDIRILDIVVASGGLGEFAAGNRASLVRSGPNGQVNCRVRLGDLIGGDMSQNILVYPGDVLVVPEARF